MLFCSIFRFCLKCILDVLDLGGAFFLHYSDHVEADLLGSHLGLAQVLLGERANRRLLAGRDGFEGASELAGAAEFHLDEDESSSVAHDQVYLPAASAVVSLDQFIAASGEVTERDALAPVSGTLFTQLPPRLRRS